MNAAIAIRKTPEGRIQAHRKDGKPLTDADREEARSMALFVGVPSGAWVTKELRDGGKLKAVKVCSGLLQDQLWVIVDRRYQPKDGLAIYYPEEFLELKSKTQEQVREIHRIKLTFPGCRVIQEGPEAIEPK